jgi:hypothetical protein
VGSGVNVRVCAGAVVGGQLHGARAGLAVRVTLLGFDFTVYEPADLVERFRIPHERTAAPGHDTRDSSETV